jgi:polyisoprenoid-binding protein YceI
MALYKIDPYHSDINFKVKHLMISTVTGCFQKFDGTMETEKPDFSDAVIKFECDVNSISTNISDRDAHLKSPDFFDEVNFPNITFESTKVKKQKDLYLVKGNLTIKGTTNEIELIGSYNGNDVDAYGQIKYGFELEGSINRNDFGLNFNMIGGKGSGVIGQEIKIAVSVQMLIAELV